MTKPIAIFLFCLMSVAAFSQKKKQLNNDTYDNKFLHLGFTLAINKMGYDIQKSGDFLSKNDTVYGIEQKPGWGFGLGLLADLKMNNYLNFRFEPGLQLCSRYLVYTVRDVDLAPRYILTEEPPMEIPTIYVDFPVLLKVRAKRINNYRPYFISGMSMKYDYESRRENQKNKGYSIRTKPMQFYYEIGFGIDSYMPFFKFSSEIKFSQGINNLLVDDNVEYTQSIDRLLSHMLVLSLHFE